MALLFYLIYTPLYNGVAGKWELISQWSANDVSELICCITDTPLGQTQVLWGSHAHLTVVIPSLPKQKIYYYHVITHEYSIIIFATFGSFCILPYTLLALLSSNSLTKYNLICLSLFYICFFIKFPHFRSLPHWKFSWATVGDYTCRYLAGGGGVGLSAPLYTPAERSGRSELLVSGCCFLMALSINNPDILGWGGLFDVELFGKKKEKCQNRCTYLSHLFI